MATIRKRQGKWQVQIRHYGQRGASKTFLRKQEAEQWARELEVSFDQNNLASRTITYPAFKTIIERYTKEISANKRGHIREKYFLQYLAKTDLAQLKLDQIQAQHIARLRDQRLKKNKPDTVLRELTIINHIFNICIKDWSYPLCNPVKQIYKPRSSCSRKRRLTFFEYNYLVNNNRMNSKLKAIIELAIETGMRRGEILKIEQHHMRDRTLMIPLTKNGISREIPLTKKAFNILHNSSLPFLMTPNALRLAWSRLKKKGDIKDLHFHDLRHEAISRFFEKGLSIPEVALISGHRDVRMLFRYTHLKASNIINKL
jgi:integrase